MLIFIQEWLKSFKRLNVLRNMSVIVLVYEDRLASLFTKHVYFYSGMAEVY